MIKIRWWDNDGTEVVSNCFDHNHAWRFMQSLTAAGLAYVFDNRE